MALVSKQREKAGFDVRMIGLPFFVCFAALGSCACGSDSNPLSCGSGTEEKDGMCVPVSDALGIDIITSEPEDYDGTVCVTTDNLSECVKGQFATRRIEDGSVKFNFSVQLSEVMRCPGDFEDGCPMTPEIGVSGTIPQYASLPYELKASSISCDQCSDVNICSRKYGSGAVSYKDYAGSCPYRASPKSGVVVDSFAHSAGISGRIVADMHKGGLLGCEHPKCAEDVPDSYAVQIEFSLPF